MDGRAARTLACVLVVLVHTNLHLRPTAESWWPFGGWGLPLYGLAVPTFLLLSGAARPSGARLRRLVAPFVVWSGVILASGALGSITGPALVWTVLAGAWQLYYLPLLAQLVGLSLWLEPRLSTRTIVAAGLAASLLGYAVSDVLMWWRPGDGGAFEIEARRLFVPWSAFYALGVALRREPAWRPRLVAAAPWLLLAAVPACALHGWEMSVQLARNGYDDREQFMLGALPFQIVGTLALVGAMERWPSAVLARLAPLTFGIYLVHTPILYGVYGLCRRWGWTSVQSYEVPAVGVGVLVLSAAVVGLVARVGPPPVRAAFGVR